jgi:hypothetical protein
VWAEYGAPDRRLAEQGWKIHVSTTPTDASGALEIVAGWCRGRAWAFKHLVDTTVLDRANDKDAARSSSGKFITVYPDASELTGRALDELVRRLGDRPGPRILGDLQWRRSTVHVRYGAFRPLRTWDGLRAIRTPSGELAPDRRGVVFDPPSWLTVPDWIESERERERGRVADGLPELSVDGAYSFSNAGGVYRAVHEVHGRVVVKEGREHVAVHEGRDAAARIEHEHAVLTRIDDLGIAPRPLGTFRAGGSAFAVLEQLEGIPFNRAVMSRNPFTRSPDPDDATRAAFADDVARTIVAVREQLAALHAIGIIHGDVAPRNVLVEPSGEVRLLDLESASPNDLDTHRGAAIATPGFAAPRSVVGVARDLFSVACLHLAAFVPLTSLIPLDPAKVDDLLTAAERWFPTARLGWVRETLIGAVNPSRTEPSEGLDQIRSLTGGLRRRLASAERVGTDGGRQGITLALHRAGALVPDVQMPFHERDPDALGLLTGQASDVLRGVAAPMLLAALRRSANTLERVDLEGGLAGIGCALLEDEDQRGRDASHTVARRLATFVDAPERLSQLRPGLLSGPSGIALFLALYARYFDDDGALAAAERALRCDVDRLEQAGDVGLQLRRDGRLVPFLGSGSAGVGIAAIQVLRAGGSSVSTALLQGVRDAAATPFTVHAGVVDGRAGLVHFLVDLAELDHPSSDRDDITALLERHRQAFAVHRLRSQDGDRYPGVQLTAPDDGYTHGGAGVLSALVAIRELGQAPTAPEVGTLPSFLRADSRSAVPR